MKVFLCIFGVLLAAVSVISVSTTKCPSEVETLKGPDRFNEMYWHHYYCHLNNIGHLTNDGYINAPRVFKYLKTGIHDLDSSLLDTVFDCAKTAQRHLLMYKMSVSFYKCIAENVEPTEYYS